MPPLRFVFCISGISDILMKRCYHYRTGKGHQFTYNLGIGLCSIWNILSPSKGSSGEEGWKGPHRRRLELAKGWKLECWRCCKASLSDTAHWTMINVECPTVRKMGLILRSIERMLKMQFSMAHNFTLPNKPYKHNLMVPSRILFQCTTLTLKIRATLRNHVHIFCGGAVWLR